MQITARGIAALLIVLPASAAAADLELRLPRGGPAVRVLATREVTIPPDSSLVARSGFEPLLIPPGEVDDKTFEMRGPLAVIRDNRLQKLNGVWSIGGAGAEVRAVLGEREPFVVLRGSASGGFGSETVQAMPLGKLLAGAGDDGAIRLPAGFRSPLVARAGMRLLATGYTYERNQDGVPTAERGAGLRQAPNIAIYDVAAGKPRMLAMIESFSEHAENNLASGVTNDGIVHMIATEVLVTKGNHSRVHHLRFDTMKRTWLEPKVLFTRSEFTSMNTPRLVATGDTVDALWLPDGGGKRGSSDGLYAHRVGEGSIWRLHYGRGEYAVLPNADGRGALLVGVAVNPDRDGVIRWFLRRDATWTTAGETDFGKALYTLTINGTEPFALWRDNAGAVHAAFDQLGTLLIADLQIPR